MFYSTKKILVNEKWEYEQVIGIDEHGFITSIEPIKHFEDNNDVHSLSRDNKYVDLGDTYIMPGLIDTHVHGANGFDVMDATHDSLNNMSKFFASKGVVAFVATTLTAPIAKIRSALIQVGRSRTLGVDGAELLGAYLEGPYFTEKNKGAHPIDFFRGLDNQELDELISYADGSLITVALAPEKENAMSAIRHLKKKGIKVMIGHTDADSKIVEEAFAAGADGIVHCYNGMPAFHHRDPGVIGIGLCNANSYVEIIADGHHVHPTAIDMAHRCCGERLTLITDSMQAAGLPDGQYKLGEYDVQVANGIVRTQSNSLAGSTLFLIDAVKNIQKWLDLAFEQAWLRASLTPAKSLGLEHKLGSIAVGKKASMVAFSAQDKLLYTWVNGKVVFDCNTFTNSCI